MKRVRLHLIAFALLLPCMMAFNEGKLVLNFLGLAWILVLFFLSSTMKGKRFIRDYYREILRLERF